MGEPAILVDGLTKRYGAVEAVAGTSFQVEQGECFALLGPNGAGKTTTTEILEGYRSRDAGRVLVLGSDPARASRRWRSQIGIVLQSDRDLTDLTVNETVEHFAGYYPDPHEPAEVIAAVGLTEKSRARNSQLSGGQRRRLDVALGIIGRPRLLFLDEPTTGFDPEARREFWGLIEDLKERGTTILLTTHYLDEAEHLADRVAVIARGRVVACDPPSLLGGRERDSSIVSWREDGRPASESTSTPTDLVRRLAERFDGEVPALRISRPTLEDVYLRLIADDTEAAS